MPNKNLIISMRVNPEEKKILEERALKNKRKLSDFMRCELLHDKNLSGWNS